MFRVAGKDTTPKILALSSETSCVGACDLSASTMRQIFGPPPSFRLALQQLIHQGEVAPLQFPWFLLSDLRDLVRLLGRHSEFDGFMEYCLDCTEHPLGGRSAPPHQHRILLIGIETEKLPFST